MIQHLYGLRDARARDSTVEVFRQCVGVSRQWLELRRLVDDDGRRERERESEESIYIQKKSGDCGA